MIIDKLFFLIACTGSLSSCEMIPSTKEWTLNTSNKNKEKELRCLFSKHGISLNITSIDLKEIEADPLTVAVHKASQLNDRVIIEDTSLEIDGIEIGVNLRKKFEYLTQHIDEYIGKKAVWTVILAYKEKNQVYLYKGAVAGKFVLANGENDFDFIPEGAETTYTEDKPECFDSRALAVKAFIEQKPTMIRPAIFKWYGHWQNY